MKNLLSEHALHFGFSRLCLRFARLGQSSSNDSENYTRVTGSKF